MEVLIFLAVVLLWLIPVIAATMVGSEKGRMGQGFTFGALSGVFGLIAIAALEPAEDILHKRSRSMASVGIQPLGFELETQRCGDCLTSIPRGALVCYACGRETSLSVSTPGKDPDLMLSVEVNGVAPSSGDSGSQEIIVEPGYVTLSVCDDECEMAEHELTMTADVSRNLLHGFTYVYTTHNDEEIYNLNGKTVGIHWQDIETESEENPGLMVIDWTETFSQVTGSTDNVYVDSDEKLISHGVLELTGVMADEFSEIHKFENSLAISTDVAALWAVNEITSEQVSKIMEHVGKIRR